MFMVSKQELFAIYATLGVTAHVQVLLRRYMKIYKIQTIMSAGSIDHVK